MPFCRGRDSRSLACEHDSCDAAFGHGREPGGAAACAIRRSRRGRLVDRHRHIRRCPAAPSARLSSERDVNELCARAGRAKTHPAAWPHVCPATFQGFYYRGHNLGAGGLRPYCGRAFRGGYHIARVRPVALAPPASAGSRLGGFPSRRGVARPRDSSRRGFRLVAILRPLSQWHSAGARHGPVVEPRHPGLSGPRDQVSCSKPVTFQSPGPNSQIDRFTEGEAGFW
jgi:hypothetical protein